MIFLRPHAEDFTFTLMVSSCSLYGIERELEREGAETLWLGIAKKRSMHLFSGAKV